MMMTWEDSFYSIFISKSSEDNAKTNTNTKTEGLKYPTSAISFKSVYLRISNMTFTCMSQIKK